MRGVPKRLGLALLILGLLSVVTSVFEEAQAQERESYSGLPVPRFVALKDDKVFGRAGPNHDVVVIYRMRGLPVKVIAEDPDDDWRRVEDHTGRRVWIKRIMLVENKHAVTLSPGVLFAEPTEDALPRARVEQGVMAKLETCRGEWCRIRTKSYRGWTEKSKLWGAL